MSIEENNNKLNVLKIQPARKLGAGRGWYWINEGFRYFNQAKYTWMLSIFVFVFNAMFLVYIFPVFQILLILIFPFITVGFAMACHDIELGKPMSIAYLFKGFTHINKLNILRYGFMLIFLMIIAQIISSMFIGLFGISQDAIAIEIQYLSTQTDASFQSILDSPVLLKYFIVTIAVMLPITAINLIAPYLIAFSNLTVPQVIKHSFLAVIKNIFALLVYAFILVIIFSVAVLLLKGINALLTLLLNNNPVIVSYINIVMLMPLMMAFVSLSYCSAYVAFKDMFLGEEI